MSSVKAALAFTLSLWGLSGCATRIADMRADVKIAAECPDGVAVGSGVVTRDGVLTAYHVVDCPFTSLTIVGQDFVWQGKPTVRPTGDDLAYLSLLFANPVTTSVPRLSTGDIVCVHARHPVGRLICGPVVGRTPSGAYVHSLPVFPGNSGGGVYVGNQVVGVTTSAIRCESTTGLLETCGGLFEGLHGKPPAW